MNALLVVLLACATVISGQIVSPGRCQENVDVVKMFQVQKYVGDWFEIHRYENDEQLSGDCATVLYVPVQGGINVTNTMVASGRNVTVEGFAMPNPAANGDGKLFVTFPLFGDTLYDYWVLSTDYTSYSMVYNCVNLPGNNRQILSWILSRKPTLSPAAVLAVDKVIQKVDGISWDNFRETIHSEASCRITGN